MYNRVVRPEVSNTFAGAEHQVNIPVARGILIHISTYKGGDQSRSWLCLAGEAVLVDNFSKGGGQHNLF